MGADDDADCVEHVWILEELHLTLNSADQVEQCDRCVAVRYQTDQAERARRPRLG